MRSFLGIRGSADAERPSASALAREEAALRRLGPAAPLSREHIDRLVAGALQPNVRSHGLRRLLLVAGLLIVTIVPIGWIGAKIVWPERKLAPLTLPYANAVLVATSPERQDAEYLSAIHRIDENCAGPIALLRQLCEQSEQPDLQRTAIALRDEFLTILEQGATKPPEPVTGDLHGDTAVAGDNSRTAADREEALHNLGDSVRSGLTALRVARSERIKDPETAARAQFFLTRIVGDLKPR